MFTQNDLEQMESIGIQVDIVEKQVENFKKGFPYAQLTEAATLENKGIESISKPDIANFVKLFENESKQKKILKFVPASGAATRMFKCLFDVIHDYTGNSETFTTDFPEGARFIQNLKRFAFYDKLSDGLFKNGINLSDCLQNKDYKTILQFVLGEEGMQYGQLPKALLDFHKYGEVPRTALEEHLVEGTVYARQKDQIIPLHFTVSSEHRSLIEKKLKNILPIYELLYGVNFSISLSEQKPSTDTIAVTEDNELFRDQDHQLVFRPGGHGALIENLNECEADLIFIKNIDNVVMDYCKDSTYLYKKVIGGLLITLQKKIFNFLHLLDHTPVKEFQIHEIETFVEKELHITLPDNYKSLSQLHEKKQFLKEKLNRPIRICGMVKNEGEPGGGPFFVKNSKGEISLQIIESSQVDHKNPKQELIFKSSTHFNPVDLVCGIKDYKGNYFYLKNFIDPETGFITIKSKDGKTIKAQELPGLWNGAMADWITLFLEVPLSTFNPVKTVNDLLRKAHQPEA